MQTIIKAGTPGVSSFTVDGKETKLFIVVAKDTPADARNICVKIGGAADAIYISKANIAFDTLITSEEPYV